MATPPADRWELMKLLQGTWVGVPLDSERMRITGWTDMSFTASSDRNNNGPMGFNYKANEFLLQQNWVRFDRSVVTTGTTEPTFGFRSDWILPGSDYKFTVAHGLFSNQLTANNGRPNLYGIDPVQFYAEAYFPTVGLGLDVKVGRFFAQYGVQSIEAVSNVLPSHTYTFLDNPFTQTGFVCTLQLTPEWSAQAGLVLGGDVFFDGGPLTFIGGVKWAATDGRDSVALATILGSGKFDPTRGLNNQNILDLIVTHKLDGRLTYTFEALGGYQTNNPGVGTATWLGVVNYLTYDLSPRLSATGRLEFWYDAEGVRTGFRGLYTTPTIGLNFRPVRDVIFRPEIRYDYNGESRPFEDHHGLFTATADVILRW